MDYANYAVPFKEMMKLNCTSPNTLTSTVQSSLGENSSTQTQENYQDLEDSEVFCYNSLVRLFFPFVDQFLLFFKNSSMSERNQTTESHPTYFNRLILLYIKKMCLFSTL